MRDLDSNLSYTKINWYLRLMINNNYHGPDTINLYPIVSNNKNTISVICVVSDCYFDDKKGFYSIATWDILTHVAYSKTVKCFLLVGFKEIMA